MARSSDTDTQYLEQKSGKWRVTVAVPRELQKELGTRLKRPLNTDSLAVANRLKWAVVAELKAAISGAASATGKDRLTQEAIGLAALVAKAKSEEEREDLDDVIASRAEEIAGKPIGRDFDPETGEPVPVLDPQREQQAEAFMAVARGKATPIAYYHDAYCAGLRVKARTLADDHRAIKYLAAWCEENDISQTVQAINRKIAVRFADDLGKLTGGLQPRTLNKYLLRLSRYWQWLTYREHASSNVWEKVTVAVPDTPHDEEERPFTDDEMKKLLEGPATQAMQDLMRLGALTGARLDPIVDLKVKDCEGGLFVFKPQKREKKPRAVPIHPDLAEIVRRRTEGKAPDDDVFPEWPEPARGSLRERSFKASNAFTDYRREVGVDHVIPGKRRSLVNFHSFRRWFITKAERADQMESIIAAVVGHKRGSITLDRYSAGPLMEQARRCVEAVKLPA